MAIGAPGGRAAPALTSLLSRHRHLVSSAGGSTIIASVLHGLLHTLAWRQEAQARPPPPSSHLPIGHRAPRPTAPPAPQAAVDAPRSIAQNEQARRLQRRGCLPSAHPAPSAPPQAQSLEPQLYAAVGAALDALGFNTSTRFNHTLGFLHTAQRCADGRFRGAADDLRLPEAAAQGVP